MHKTFRENEPLIWDDKFGSSRNVDTDTQGNPDYDSEKYTEIQDAAIQENLLKKSVPENEGIEPDNIIFLTCDLSEYYR